jgi:SAM-dependent methyltransferase
VTGSVLDWIRGTLTLRPCNTDELLYEHMASQSGRCLPIIYQPFDVENPAHWMDRGSLFDYLRSTGGGRPPDFGPGDGWPSLILAPYVAEVVGVDGSQRRVAVCRENAARLRIENVRFEHVEPGAALPFGEGSFDSVTAASSVEQTPDPFATLRELYRVLRPGGRLRIDYESLSRYAGRSEREAWLLELAGGTRSLGTSGSRRSPSGGSLARCRLMIYDRDIEGERVVHYGLDLALTIARAETLLVPEGGEVSIEALDVEALERVRPHIVDAVTCTLTHPSGPTLARWLKEIGFEHVLPSHSGSRYARRLYGVLGPDRRPRDLESLDAYLGPVVEAVVDLAAPMEMDPMITAVK